MRVTRRWFRNYVVAPDLVAAREFEALCVSGGDADCGEQAMVSLDGAEVDRWIIAHFRATGHDRFQRSFSDYATVQAGEWRA